MADSFITLGTRLDSASLQSTLRQINAAISRVERRGVNVSVDSGKFTRPLGKITGATNEFTKSLEASNARVLAFGASAGAIFQVQRAFEFLLKSTIQVEKRLQDVNVILGQTDKGLARFGNNLFQVAQKTAQSFDTVAEAATELARQGLSTEETLKRTNDALILTRLSGMDAASSVSSLTAALNTFNREALSSTQVINKLANVDAAFAVSTDDLAQAMRRVGNTAQDVGVSFDQLLAITASVQQTTARGGPVIGNALKSIFTRIQRRDTLNLLEELGVKVRDLEGQMMPAMNVLGNLAKKFPALSKAQQAHTAEVVAGVFQMNNLRAILSDLGQEFSIYDKAVKVSTTSTNEAILRNEMLNKTLDAQVKKTMALATQAAKKVGDLTLRPVTERVVGIMQKVLGDINEKDTQDVGGKIAQGMLSGIGNFLQGPGLLLLTGFIGKLGMNLAKFVKESGAQFMGLNTAAVQQKTLQEGIAKILEAQPQLIQRAATSAQARVQVEREIIAMLEQETLVMQKMEKVAARMAGMFVRGGATVSGSGQVQAPAYMRPRGAAKGHVPSFSKRSAISETISAAEGGYKAGAIKQMRMPGVGKVTYNSREQVKHVPGFAQPFINPPAHSKAGRQHKQKSIAKTGIDPYSVPNFANPAMLSLFGRGRLGVGTIGMPGKGAASSLESFGIGRFYKSGPKAPKGQKNVLRTAYDHALAGHGVSGAKGKIALGEIGEVAVGRATMPSDVAKRFYQDLLAPGVGVAARKGFVDAVGGKGNAQRLAQDIIYHPSGTARSFQGARERAIEVLGTNHSARGSFFAKAEATHSSLLEKALVDRGAGQQLMPFSKIGGGQAETILDALALKGGKIIGPAEFKPSFHAGMSGRDARGSLSYKSLFSSDSGKEGGLLHFLRSGIEKGIARGGYKDKSGKFHSSASLGGDLKKLDSYIDSVKVADFQRMQKASQGEIRLEGSTGATAVKDIFGKDVMKILQGSPSSSNYDQLMKHFGAAQGFIPGFNKDSFVEAFKREKEASGLPLSQLYSTTVDTPNYAGPVVANKRDEPNRQALLKAIKGHPDPSRAGMAARGFVPNYADSVDYMGMTSGLMMAGMMMQMGGDSAQEKQMLQDQKRDYEKQKDVQKRAKAAQKKQEKAMSDQRAAQDRQREIIRKADADARVAHKERLQATHGTKATPGGPRTGGVRGAQTDVRAAEQRIIEREQRKAIQQRWAGDQPRMYKELRRFESQAKYGTQAKTGPLAEARQAGERRAQRIIAMSTTDRGAAPVRGAKGVDLKGDKAASDLTKKTLLLQKAREAEARAASRAQQAADQKTAAQKEIVKQDKEIAKTSKKVAAAKHAETKAAEKAATMKPDRTGAAAKWIRGKGFGLGIGIQMMAGVAEQFVGGKGETPEERAEKAKVRGIGTAAGMAGTGAMIGGPWGAAIGLAVGSGLAVMDHQKASKKTAEDYAKAIAKETEARKKALLGAEAYVKMQGRLTGMFTRGAGPAETGMMRRQMREQLMQVEDAGLRRELIAAAGDEGKMREAMAKVQDAVTMQEKRGSIGVMSAKAGEGGSGQAGVMKDLAKTLSAAFDLQGIKTWELMGKSSEELTVKLQEMGVGAKEAADMVQALGEENQGLIPQILAQAKGYEQLEEQTSESVESIERMALATADLNYRLSQISNSFQHLMTVSKAFFDHSQKVTKELSSAITGDDTLGQERRERFGLSGNILKNIETNTLKNTILQKRFHDAILKMTMEKSSAGGSLPPGLMDLQVLARQMVTGRADLAADQYREIIRSGELGREQARKLEDGLSKAEYEIKQNNLNLAQSNRLLIIQNQIAESNRGFERRRRMQQSLTAGGALGGGGIIDALRKLTSVAGIPTRGEHSRVAMAQMQGLRDLEKMGFDFANGIGKAMKEGLLQQAFRAEAPDALEALGMSPDNVSKIINTNFNPNVAKEIIEGMNSAQGGMMAQVVDAANLSKIAQEERAYKAKLLEAEFKNRNMLVESLGANVDVTALLIGSNYDLIVSNEKLGKDAMGAEEFGAAERRKNDQVYKAAISGAMTQAVTKMGEIMSKANSGFMQAVEVFRGEQSLQHTRISQEKAFAALEGKTAGTEDMLGNLSRGTKFTMTPPEPESLYDQSNWFSRMSAWILQKEAAALGSLLPGETMTWENLTEGMDVSGFLGVTGRDVKASSFQKNMLQFMERTRVGGTEEDKAMIGAAFDAYKATLTDANVPDYEQETISMVRAQEALLKSFAKISEIAYDPKFGLLERRTRADGGDIVTGSLPLNPEDWGKIKDFMGEAAMPEEAMLKMQKALSEMVFEGDAGNWQPNMISALSKLSEVLTLLGRKQGFEAHELRSDPKKLVQAMLAIETALVGVHPSQQGQIYTRAGHDVLAPGVAQAETIEQAEARGARTAMSYGNEIPVFRQQARLQQGEYAQMMTQVSDTLSDYRSAGKLLLTNFQKTFTEGRTVSPEEAKGIKRAIDMFEGQEARIRKVLEALALRTGGEESFYEKEKDILPLLDGFDDITEEFLVTLRSIIQPNKGITVDKKLAEQIATLLRGTIPELKPFRQSQVDLGGPVPDRSAGGAANVAKAWTTAFTEGVKRNMAGPNWNVESGMGIKEALTNLQVTANDWASASSILNSTVAALEGTKFEIDADPFETPLLAVQQSLDALKKANMSGDETIANAFNNKEDVVISTLQSILEAILSDETVSESQREEIVNALRMLPEDYKKAMEQIETRSGTRILRDELLRLRQGGQREPIPAPLIPGSMLAGQVQTGRAQTTRPLTTMARQTFGKYGRAFLRKNQGYQGPRSGLPSASSLLGFKANFGEIPDPRAIDKMLDTPSPEHGLHDPLKAAQAQFLKRPAKVNVAIQAIVQRAAEKMSTTNTEMIEEIHKLAPVLHDMGFEELEEGLASANKDMSGARKANQAAIQKAAGLARSLGKHSVEMANVFINQNLLAGFGGPNLIKAARGTEKQWMDTIRDAGKQFTGDVFGPGDKPLPEGAFRGGMFGGKLTPAGAARKAQGGIFTPRLDELEHSLLGMGGPRPAAAAGDEFTSKDFMMSRFLRNLRQGGAHQRVVNRGGGGVGPPRLGFTAAKEHTILGGETAGGIAKKYGVSLANLTEANLPQIRDINQIKAGDKMKIPAQYSIEHGLGHKLTANQQKKIADQLEKQFKEGVAYHNEMKKAKLAAKEIADNAKEIASWEEKINARTAEAHTAQEKLKILYEQRSAIEKKLNQKSLAFKDEFAQVLKEGDQIGDRNLKARHYAVVARMSVEGKAIKERRDQSAILQQTIDASGDPALLDQNLKDPRAKAAAQQIQLNLKANQQSQGLMESLKQEREALLEANTALGEFSKAIGISTDRLQDMSPFQLDLELLKQEAQPRKDLLAAMSGPRISQPDGKMAAQVFSSIIPSRTGEAIQANLREQMQKILTIDKEAAAGPRKVALAKSKVAEAKILLAHAQRSPGFEKFKESRDALGQTSKASEEANNKVVELQNRKSELLKAEGDQSEALKKVEADLKSANEMAVIARRNEVVQTDAHNAKHAEYINIIEAGKLAEAERAKAVNSSADALSAQKEIIDNWGSVAQAAIEIQKRFSAAEHVKRMEALDTQIANTTMSLAIMDDPKKFQALLESTKKLTDIQLRLAARQARLEEAAGIGTPSDTYQREQDVTRQQLRTGQIGVWEAFGADTFERGEAMSRGWKERVLDDMIEIREGMIQSFSDGWAAFALEGKSASDVAKQWARDFLRMINQAFYNATLGRFMGNLMSGGFGNYGRPAGQTQQSGGQLHGPSHTQGGIPIEAEGGEYIIRKSEVSKPGALRHLHDINQGRVFQKGGPVGVNRNPQIYQDGGPVISNYQKAWERKLDMHQMLRVSGAIPSTGFFGQPLHQQGPMTEDQLAIALQERKKAWEKQNPNWTGLKPDFSMPRGDEWYGLSLEALKKRAELVAEEERMSAIVRHSQKKKKVQEARYLAARSYDLMEPAKTSAAGARADIPPGILRSTPISRRLWHYTFANNKGFKAKPKFDPLSKEKGMFVPSTGELAQMSDGLPEDQRALVWNMFTNTLGHNEGHIMLPQHIDDLEKQGLKHKPTIERLRGPLMKEFNEEVNLQRGFRGLIGHPDITAPAKFYEQPEGWPAYEGQRKITARMNMIENIAIQRAIDNKGSAWYNKFVQARRTLPVTMPRGDGLTPVPTRPQPYTPMPPGPIQIDPATGLPIGGGLDDNATGLGLPGPIPGGFPQMIPKFNMGGHVGPNLPAEFSDDDIRKVEKMMRERIDRDEAVRRQKLIREAQKQLKDATKKSGGKGIKHTHPKPKGGLSPKKFSKPMGPIKGPGGPGGRMNMLMMAPGILNELFWNRKDGWNLNVPKNIKDAWQRGKEAPRRPDPIMAAEGGLVTVRDAFGAKVPKLDKDYISKLASNPHLLGWLKDPNNIERFGFTENDTFESAYMKMIRHAEKIGLKPGKAMTSKMTGAGGSRWEHGMTSSVANKMMGAGWIEQEAFGVLNEWFNIRDAGLGLGGTWKDDEFIKDGTGPAGQVKDRQRALNVQLTKMGLMAVNPKGTQLKPLKVDGKGGPATAEAMAMFIKAKKIPAGPHAFSQKHAAEKQLGLIEGLGGVSLAQWRSQAPFDMMKEKFFKPKDRETASTHPYTGGAIDDNFLDRVGWQGFPSKYEIVPGKGIGHVVKHGEGLTNIGLQYKEEMMLAGSKDGSGTTLNRALQAANPKLMATLKQRAGNNPDISKFLRPNDVVLIPGGGHLFDATATKPGRVGGKPWSGFRQGWWQQFNKINGMYGTVTPQEYQQGGVVWDPQSAQVVPSQFKRQAALRIPETGGQLLPQHRSWNNRLQAFWLETFRASGNDVQLATQRFYEGVQEHMTASRVRQTRGAHGVSPGGYRYTRGPAVSTLAGGNIDAGGVAGVGPPTGAHRGAMRRANRYFQREQTPDFAAWGVHPSAVDKDTARVIFSEVGPQHPELVHLVGDVMRNRYNNQASRSRHGISTGHGISIDGARYPARVAGETWQVQAPNRRGRGYTWRNATAAEATTASPINMRDIAWQGAPGGFRPATTKQFSAIGDATNDNWHLSGRLAVFQQSPQGFADMNSWLSGNEQQRAEVRRRYRNHYGNDVLGNARNSWRSSAANIQSVWKKSLQQSATPTNLGRTTLPGQQQSGLTSSDEEWYKSWQIPMNPQFAGRPFKPTSMTQNVGPFFLWRPDYREGFNWNNPQQNRGRPLPERRNGGGLITAGSGTKDDVHVMLRKGEVVMTESAVKENGVQFFKDIEAGRVRMEEGGEVDEEIIAQAKAATEEDDEEEVREGKRNPASLNERYGDNLAEAWGGAPSDYGMEGVATQDKVWYGSGNTPGQGMLRTAEVVEEQFGKGFRYGGANTFAMNDPDRPSLGRYFVDHKMSTLAMEDSNNPQNEMREKRRKMFVGYKNYLQDEYKNRKEKWDAFKKKKKQMLKAAWIQFAIAMAQVGVKAKGMKANKKWGTADQAKADPENFKEMPAGMDADAAGTYVNPGAQADWASKMKWADSPLGSATIAGGTTALVGWGMGMKGSQIALTAGTAAATAGLTSYSKIKGLGKAEQNSLNSDDPAVQEAALGRWKKHLKPEEIANIEQKIQFNTAEQGLKHWNAQEKRFDEQLQHWKMVQNDDQTPAALREQAIKVATGHEQKLRNVRASRKAFIAHTQAVAPGLLSEDAGGVFSMNEKRRANLKSVKLGWERSKEAANVRRASLENANEHADMLQRMMRPGMGGHGAVPMGAPPFKDGGIVDGELGTDKIRALLTKGEFVLSNQAVDNFPGGAPALIRMNDMAKFGGQVSRFAQGGIVGGRDTQFSPTSPIASVAGGNLGPSMTQGTEGMTDSLIQLVDIVQSIRDTVDQETQEKQREKRVGQNDTQDSAGGVNQEITNNVSVTVNVNKDGTAEASTEASSEGGQQQEDGEQDADKHEKFAELMQGVVLQTIVEEQRPGGLLYKK